MIPCGYFKGILRGYLVNTWRVFHSLKIRIFGVQKNHVCPDYPWLYLETILNNRPKISQKTILAPRRWGLLDRLSLQPPWVLLTAAMRPPARTWQKTLGWRHCGCWHQYCSVHSKTLVQQATSYILLWHSNLLIKTTLNNSMIYFNSDCFSRFYSP